jgi:hypothetical protein
MTEDELRREQSQIFELLRTEFDVVIVGHSGDRGPVQILPPQPPGIHAFCYVCDEREVKALTTNGDYLWTLMVANIISRRIHEKYV